MAWSTCLGETLKVVLAVNDLEALSRVRREVDLHRDKSGGYYFVPRAYVSIDGVSDADAEKYAARAHAPRPISKRSRGWAPRASRSRPTRTPTTSCSAEHSRRLGSGRAR